MNYKLRQCIITLFFIFYCLAAGAQVSNPCGVVARVSPSTADSVVPVNTVINLSSTSVNATSVKWLYDGFYLGNSAPTLNYQIKAGIHRISLVAYNGNCTDTTTVVYFSAGTPHNNLNAFTADYGDYRYNEEGTCIDKTPDGGFVFGGVQYLYAPLCGETGVLVKTRDRGCIDWSKKFVRQYPYYCTDSKITNVKSTADSNYYVVINHVELAKLDKNGNLLWNKRYSLNGWSTSVNTIAVDSDEAVYAAAQSLGYGWMITKLDKNGNQVWNKYFGLAHSDEPDSDILDYVNPTGLVWLKGKIYVGGYVFRGKDYFNFMTCVNAATGAREWQYGYKDPELTSGLFTSISSYDTLIMASSGGQGQTVTLINPQGDVVKNIKTNFYSSYNPKVSKAVADSKGHIYMMQWTEKALDLQPYYYYATNFAEIDTALNQYGGLVLAQYERGYFNDAAIGNNDNFGAAGVNFGFVDDGALGSRDLYLLKTNALKNSEFCNNSNDETYTVSTKAIDRFDLQYLTDSSLTIGYTDDTEYHVEDAYLQSRYNCPDYIDSCSFMSISGPVNLCNYSAIYTYRLHRNKKCILAPQWDIPAGVRIVSQTDSSLSLQFPGFGEYKLLASLNSCVPIKDSLTISIRSKSHPLNLGADTSICPGNSLTLHAGNDFFFYQWNDGSTDSLLTVKEPGQYFVKVTDSCSNVLTDTINITQAALIPISIGEDRTKCNDDTLHLTAPAGFLNYKWLPDYNISSDVSASVIINPLVDTSYVLMAEKTPGCFASDTIRVKVYHSPAIDLGSDTSFCSGDSLMLNAGTGFAVYSWNTGDDSQVITASKTGVYIVSAKTGKGCTSGDTIRILNVFPNPKVSLDHDDKLCAGASRILDAGSFESYLWNTGSTSRNITVNATGYWSVRVTDNNNCQGTDSVSITTILPAPTGFLPADTAICSYGDLVIRPLQNFNRYLWSNGQLASSVTVTKAGVYWLEVTDLNHCVGRDTISVIQKDCLQGFYIPNAFTPNYDGKNDLFKPMIFGRLRSYQFSIFNRFGQVVFQSADISRGWNGAISGNTQDTQTYVWVCTYQFEDEKPVVKKGTVTLLR
jgi:gliding motility-associated-like protein